ncbi:PASTA domain-containing protein [Micromonospora yangpuensis]|uniref:PASTA domain-containing protein n=1 Tax=Micromonospora yangpuensis TaxID=683228 RepID=A0A1C6TXF4_9ACTN|nr:PASTA domain-containing protein [Micromonospora yangpuensis]GGM01682.1 hypothetical protein GCM10012279_19130 [Micromonospora yangpuensis]SCL46291.1 PASTA domain-containing protein [Micromonospora yangpuensis]
MSDDHQQPSDAADDDRTRGLPPVGPEVTQRAEPPVGPDVTQRAEPPVGPEVTQRAEPSVGPDVTQRAEPPVGPDVTQPVVPPHRTVAPPDRTVALPLGRTGTGVDSTARRAGPAVWSGRAGVPPPRPPEPGTEWYDDEPVDRRWWAPIALAVVALVLLGLLGTVFWFAVQQVDEPGPQLPPSPQPSVAPTTVPPSSPATTPPPTTAPATTAPPTTAPATTAPATTAPAVPGQVPVPPVVGLSQATAQAVLTGLGLSYRVEYQPSPQRPGTVIGVNPGVGVPVPAGQQVLLVVAAQNPSPTSPAAPTATGEATVTR